MILVITHKIDFTADFLINKLNQQGVPYKRLNCEEILISNCTIEYDKEFSFSLLGESNYNAVWFRRTMLPTNLNLPFGEKAYILNEIDSLMKNLFAVIDAKWLSTPHHIYRAENKLYQLKKARQIGFKTPPTIVTNDKQELKAFYKIHKDIIIKPLSQTRVETKHHPEFIFTNRVTEDHIKSIDEYDMTPCIFQSYIPKKSEIRVTVVGEEVFVAEVYSQEHEETRVDWRKKKLNFSPAILPASVSYQCVKIVKELGLEFGAIDLIKGPEGDYTFLEVNPNGQWAWIEMETKLPISQAIIKTLQI